METQNRYSQPAYDAPDPDLGRRPLRVDPNGPLPSSLPQSQDSYPPTMENGLARTSSKRRRSTGTGTRKAPIDKFPQPPAAPEVPKAPPLSYRARPTTNGQPSPNHPPSFAERARILTGRSIPQDPSRIVTERADEAPKPPKPERRASLNRPIGGLYSEIQQHKRDSYPSTASGPTSPRRFSVPSTTQHQQPEQIPRSNTENTSPVVRQVHEGSLPPAQANSTSLSAVQTPRKEWASDRSPLQNLEAKLEKRARVEEAEQKLRRSKAGSKREREGSNPVVNRSSSRRVSANPTASKSQGLSDQSPRTLADRETYGHREPASRAAGLGIRDVEGGQSLGGESKPLRANSRNQRTSRNVDSDLNQEPTRNRSRRASGDAADVRRTSQPQERGVRFQSEGDSVIDDQDIANFRSSSAQRRKKASEGLEIDPASAEARAARREQLRQGPTTMVDGRESKNVPSPQQDLYGAKVETSREDSLIASYGGSPDPVPGYAVQNSSKAPKYEVPSQTVSGIQARQKVGFGGQPGGTVDVPTQKRHYLSEVLHGRHGYAVHAHEQPGAQPPILDEWRQGGVARLTAADFLDEMEASKDTKPWWEEGGSGRRRRSQRNSRSVREVQTDQDSYQNGTGKKFSRSSQGGRIEGSQPLGTDSTATLRVRPYVVFDVAHGAKKSIVSRLKANISMLTKRSKNHQTAGLTSAYSYSCPNLADHDPAHASHFCEPYMSEKLTLSMRSIRIRPVPGVQTFTPPLYLKCGPLLRYTGLRRDKLESGSLSAQVNSEREIWRGSVMIVTTDAESTYEPAPTLRLYPEPMELLPPPPHNAGTDEHNDFPSEYHDPIAGLPKLSRTGKTVYVKPADDLGEAMDLSRVENDDGLFEETRTAAVPTSYGTPDFHHVRNGPQISRTPQRGQGNRNPKAGHRVKGVRLHAERGVTFWRFSLEVELGSDEARIAYSINNGPAIGFWVPALGHTMNIMFHSCNGFSLSVNPDQFSGPDPLWRDALNSHQTRPFHVMIGGGDQIYNDAVMEQSPLFRDWLNIKNPHHKHNAEFSGPLQEELETFYLERYSMWFSQGLFGMANSQIAMVNVWDDHGKFPAPAISFCIDVANHNHVDIIDGFGSYPHAFMSTPVFCGLGAVAYKYYMLFQHQTVPAETSADEPSWLMGAAPGPYIDELSRSVFLSLGKNVAFLGLDCRTERQRDEVLCEASYDLVFDRCRREILEGETKHLIVLLGIPIAYPRLVWLENLLTSNVMKPIKALGRAGVMGNLLNKFDGGVEILDDLDDHWTARHHKQERNWFIQELQELAADKSVRITFLGGDVHLAAIGQFYSNPKLKIPKDRDHRYMANVVSSAIVNTPPPEMMGDIMNKRNKIHHLDHETDEDMIPMFTHDVDGRTRNNKRLLPRRNWCSIREYHPGSTPPSTPSPPPSEPQTPSDDENYSPPPPRTRLQRTMSLTREDVKPSKLIRRLSGRGPPPVSYVSPKSDNNVDSPTSPVTDSYFPKQRSSTVTTNGTQMQRHSSAPLPRPGFQRRPTNMSEKAAIKGDIDHDDTSGHINLEHGLDIVLNCEVNQRDPTGITTPYRLLVPALWYEGPGDENTLRLRKPSVFKRLSSLRARRGIRAAGNQDEGNWSQQDSLSGSGSEGEEDKEEEPRPRRWSFGLTQRRQYRDQTPPLLRESREIEDESNDQQPSFQPATFPERPQQHRQFEDRKQQIGQIDSSRAGTQQQALDRLTGQRQQFPTNEQLDGPDDLPRDSIDYHEHLDNVRVQQNQGYMARRLSKADRMLGVGNARQGPPAQGNGVVGRSFADRQRNRGPQSPPAFDDEDVDAPPTQAAQGYDGLDAYADKNDKRRSWRRFFP